MSLKATVPVEASATVSLRVPRGQAGTLESGVADVVGNADGATDVTVERVTGVRPTWTDIRVDARVTLSLEVAADEEAPAEAVAATLVDAFGVTDVHDLSLDGDE